MKECDNFKKMLCDYLEGDLEQGYCEKFELHLKNCENCNNLITNIRKIIDVCNKEETLKMPSNMKNKLINYINENLKKE